MGENIPYRMGDVTKRATPGLSKVVLNNNSLKDDLKERDKDVF